MVTKVESSVSGNHFHIMLLIFQCDKQNQYTMFNVLTSYLTKYFFNEMHVATHIVKLKTELRIVHVSEQCATSTKFRTISVTLLLA